MTLFQAAVFGVIQGLTEFLPVSSSAHLVLLPWFVGWEDPGLAFDVALHWGTLAGVLGYFRKELLLLASGFFRSFSGARKFENLLPWYVVLGTLPAAAFGILFEQQAETIFRSPWVVAGALTVFSVVLCVCDQPRREGRPLEGLQWLGAMVIGAAQGIAIIPGVSRSGITISVALLCGLQRTAAVQFSFLLSIPIILGAGLFKLGYMADHLTDPVFLAGIAVSAVSGYLAIGLLMTHVKRRSFMPFVVYRLVLAAIIAGGWLPENRQE